MPLRIGRFPRAASAASHANHFVHVGAALEERFGCANVSLPHANNSGVYPESRRTNLRLP